MRTPHLVAVTLSAALLACAAGGAQMPIPLSAPPAGAVVPASYAPAGEVVVGDRGATFSDWRVVGPTVNLTRGEDGAWVGSILGQNVALKPAPGKLAGSGADLNFLRWGEYVMVQGSLGGREFQIRYLPGAGTPTQGGMRCRATPRSLDCSPSGSQGGNAALGGQAARPDAPMPQLGLALIATML
jgi:hypothetical protein